jgi:hypothetical protein
MAVNGVALAAAGTGVILLWSGLHNQSILKATQDIVQGKQPQPGGNPTVGSLSNLTAADNGLPAGSNAPEAPASLSANQAIGKMLATSFGWTGDNWNALVALWTRESGWNNTATNSGSGAFGIAQSLHGTVGGVGGNEYSASDPEGLSAAQLAGANEGNAYDQILWGLNYIKNTYGSPAAAWEHEQAQGWY